MVMVWAISSAFRALVQKRVHFMGVYLSGHGGVFGQHVRGQKGVARFKQVKRGCDITVLVVVPPPYLQGRGGRGGMHG